MVCNGRSERMIRPGIIASARRRSAVSYDSEAQTYFTEVEGRTGSVGSGKKSGINEFILYMRDTGPSGNQWQHLERLWLYDNSSEIAALTSIKNPTAPISEAINSPSFTADGGYSFNGTSSYIKTKYNPSTDSVLLQTEDHASGIIWEQTGVASDLPLEIAAGCDDGTNQYFIAPDNQNFGTIYNPCRAVGAGYGMGNTGVSSGTNSYFQGRTAGGGMKFYQSNVGASTNSGASGGGLPNKEIYLGAYNQNGTANFFWNRGGNRQNIKVYFLARYAINFAELDYAIRTYLL